MAVALAVVTVFSSFGWAAQADAATPPAPESGSVETTDVQAARDRLLQQLADELIKGDFKAAASVLTEAGRRDAVQGWAEWTEIEPAAREVIRLPEVVLEAYGPYEGKDITVYLTSGAEKLRIRRVTPTRVRASKQLVSQGQVVGTSSRDFTFTDLTAREKMVRLGREKTPERDVMRGLLACSAGVPDQAVEYLKRSDTPLGGLLVQRVENKIAARESAVQAQVNTAKEAAAKRKLTGMLRTLGIHPRSPLPDALHDAVREKRFPPETISDIRRRASELEADYGETRYVTENQELIGSLFHLMPDKISPTLLRETTRQLVKDNPREVGIQDTVFSYEDGVLGVDLSQRGNLDNISALAGLPLHWANLSGTRVRDLRPLHFAPLVYLHLNHTDVTDLRPLAGLPLRELNLFNSHNLVDLSPLKGLQLHKLDIGCWPFDNGPVGSLHDISPLEGMPLEELKISDQPKLQDISVLKGMPLKKLYLAYTGVSDLSPLEGAPLEWLNLAACKGIPDLKPLSQCPLRYIDISHAQIGDLSVLDQFPNLRIERQRWDL